MTDETMVVSTSFALQHASGVPDEPPTPREPPPDRRRRDDDDDDVPATPPTCAWPLKVAKETPITASRPIIASTRIRTTPRRRPAGDRVLRAYIAGFLSAGPAGPGAAHRRGRERGTPRSELVREILSDRQHLRPRTVGCGQADLDLNAAERRRVRRRIRRVERPRRDAGGVSRARLPAACRPSRDLLVRRLDNGAVR